MLSLPSLTNVSVPLKYVLHSEEKVFCSRSLWEHLFLDPVVSLCCETYLLEQAFIVRFPHTGFKLASTYVLLSLMEECQGY